MAVVSGAKFRTRVETRHRDAFTNQLVRIKEPVEPDLLGGKVNGARLVREFNILDHVNRNADYWRRLLISEEQFEAVGHTVERTINPMAEKLRLTMIRPWEPRDEYDFRPQNLSRCYYEYIGEAKGTGLPAHTEILVTGYFEGDNNEVISTVELAVRKVRNQLGMNYDEPRMYTEEVLKIINIRQRRDPKLEHALGEIEKRLRDGSIADSLP